MSATIETKPAGAAAPLQPAWLVMAKKELRENAKWAAMGLLALALALCYQIYNSVWTTPSSNTLRDVWNRITQTMVLGGPLIATLLGMLQIIPEQRRDLWAFLMHRPAHRSSLFWGKVAAGLLLYAVATLVPFLGVVFWTKRPGVLTGPFVWGLTLGGLGGILAGVPFYFAGLLTGLRPARWYGSRVIPIVAAGVVALLLDSAEFASLGLPAALTLIACFPFALAARSAYITAGRFDRPVFGGKPSLGIVLLAGLTLAFSAFAGLCYSVLMPIYAPRVSGVYSSYQLLPDGELVKTTSRDGSVDPVLTPVRDERGRPATTIHAKDKGSSIMPVRITRDTGDTDRDLPAYNDVNAWVAAQHDTSRPYDIVWYFIRGEGQFIRYDIQRRKATGVLGPDGLANPQDADRAGRFTDRLKFKMQLQSGEVFFVDAGSLYRVSLSEATARRVALPFPVATVQSVVSLTGDSQFGVTVEPSASGADPGVMVSNGAQFAVVSKAGDTLYTVAREYDAAAYPTVEAQGAVQTGAVHLWYERAGSKQVSIWDVHGRHVAAYSLPDISDVTTSGGDDPRFFVSLIMPSAIPAAMYAWECAHARHSESARMSAESMSDRRAKEGYVYGAICSLVWAILGVMIARRRQQSPKARAAWAFAMFWLGIPGLLMMLSMEDFPVRVVCPSCGRKRIVTRETCEYCVAPFPGPPADGTEIFGESAPRIAQDATEPATA